ncbi:MAG: hypothetical protein QOH10_255, partial [Actinomycetota bacterium]|nr:hypothetical protein [Actinomycetota bacterium]
RPRRLDGRVLARLRQSRWFGSASGFIRREGHDPTLEQGAIPVV